MVLNGDTVYANAVPSAAHSEYAATIVAKTVTFSTNLDIQIPLKAGPVSYTHLDVYKRQDQ